MVSAMARLLILGALAAVVFTVFAAVDCGLVERRRVRTLPRWGWLVLIVVLPIVGGVLWFLLGRSRLAPAVQRRPIGPDDDPAFLRSSGRSAPIVREPDEAEWRSLEQELANLDPDAEDDGGEPNRR